MVQTKMAEPCAYICNYRFTVVGKSISQCHMHWHGYSFKKERKGGKILFPKYLPSPKSIKVPSFQLNILLLYLFSHLSSSHCTIQGKENQLEGLVLKQPQTDETCSLKQKQIAYFLPVDCSALFLHKEIDIVSLSLSGRNFKF